MTDAIKQKILERAAFNEHDSYYRLGYDSEKEPHVKEMIIAARAENARLLPVVTELLELVTRLNETVNFYSSNANRQCIQWGETHVCDSYSGGNYLPDWDGDLCDEPWEPADRALADTEATLSRLAGEMEGE
jgi:hypothetical protein